jgi:8-oxo-dGTP pyrophosphatase MutT (NUDIX family)
MSRQHLQRRCTPGTAFGTGIYVSHKQNTLRTPTGDLPTRGVFTISITEKVTPKDLASLRLDGFLGYALNEQSFILRNKYECDKLRRISDMDKSITNEAMVSRMIQTIVDDYYKFNSSVDDIEDFLTSTVFVAWNLARRITVIDAPDDVLFYYSRPCDDPTTILFNMECNTLSKDFLSVEPVGGLVRTFPSDEPNRGSILIGAHKLDCPVVFHTALKADDLPIIPTLFGSIGLGHIQGSQLPHYSVFSTTKKITYEVFNVYTQRSIGKVQLSQWMSYPLNAIVTLLLRIFRLGSVTKYIAWNFEFPTNMKDAMKKATQLDLSVLKVITHLLIHFDLPDDFCHILRSADLDEDNFGFNMMTSFVLTAWQLGPVDTRGFVILKRSGTWATSLFLPSRFDRVCTHIRLPPYYDGEVIKISFYDHDDTDDILLAGDIERNPGPDGEDVEWSKQSDIEYVKTLIQRGATENQLRIARDILSDLEPNNYTIYVDDYEYTVVHVFTSRYDFKQALISVSSLSRRRLRMWFIQIFAELMFIGSAKIDRCHIMRVQHTLNEDHRDILSSGDVERNPGPLDPASTPNADRRYCCYDEECDCTKFNNPQHCCGCHGIYSCYCVYGASELTIYSIKDGVFTVHKKFDLDTAVNLLQFAPKIIGRVTRLWLINLVSHAIAYGSSIITSDKEITTLKQILLDIHMQSILEITDAEELQCRLRNLKPYLLAEHDKFRHYYPNDEGHEDIMLSNDVERNPGPPGKRPDVTRYLQNMKNDMSGLLDVIGKSPTSLQAYDHNNNRHIVVARLFDSNGLVLVGEHAARLGTEVPAGGLDLGESIIDGALRELREESGYTGKPVRYFCFHKPFQVFHVIHLCDPVKCDSITDGELRELRFIDPSTVHAFWTGTLISHGSVGLVDGVWKIKLNKSFVGGCDVEEVT